MKRVLLAVLAPRLLSGQSPIAEALGDAPEGTPGDQLYTTNADGFDPERVSDGRRRLWVGGRNPRGSRRSGVGLAAWRP